MSKAAPYSMKLSMLLAEAIAKRLSEQLDKIASRWGINTENLGRFINAVTENINYQSWVLRHIEDLIDDYGIDFLEDLPSMSVVANEWSMLIATFDDIKSRLVKKDINDYDLYELKRIVNDAELNVKIIHGLPAVSMKGDKSKYADFKINSFYPLDYYFFDTDIEAFQSMGEHTSWCTRGSYPRGSRAKSYLKDSPQIIMAKGQKLLGQLSVDLEQAKDIYNKDINENVLKQLLPKDFIYKFILRGGADKSLRYRVMFVLVMFTTPDDDVLFDLIRDTLSGDSIIDLLNFCLIYKIRNQAPFEPDLLAIEQSSDYKNFSPLRRLVAMARSVLAS